MNDPSTWGRRPSRAVSLAISAALVAIWGMLRLVVFETTMFPLAYALPLLVCVWTRDRLALFGMAAIFAVFHTAKLFWLVPADLLTPDERWANYSATLVNISVASAAVFAIIRLRERLEDSLTDISRQAEELRAQGEELASQNEQLAEQAEELTRQAEELSEQSEELATQNEELQSQSEDISTLNAELGRREALLQTLLDATRRSQSELDTLRQICAAALDLVCDGSGVAAVYEHTPGGLVRRSVVVGGAADTAHAETAVAPNSFIDLVLRENRTAALDDAGQRSDLGLLHLPGEAPFRAVLATPLRAGDRPIGALAIYLRHRHTWTDQQFRLAEWLADQCAQVLATLRMQTELRDADRRKGEFLATLSHELRNPLAPIRYAVELLGRGASPRGIDPKQVLDRQLRHLVRLVDDLLDVTRISSNKVRLQKARVELAPIVRQAVEAVAPEIDAARHELILHLREPIWLDADADRLAQVVINLLTNAARYTPAGGRVTVTAAIVGGEAELSVIDTGVGLEPQHLTRVFDMFTQVGEAAYGGLGIGLSLVKGIVELHGGRVVAESRGPGTGAVFRVTLPLAEQPRVDRAFGDTASSPALRKRVLVVDDNVDAAEMMASLLELHGHDVRMAHEGESALQAAREFLPDVGLLDIGLPGLDGYELASRLREHANGRPLHLIAVTGWGHEADRHRARSAGFDAHLTKPAAPDRILEFVARAGSGGDLEMT